jgi:hypothetical protein
MVLDSVEDLQKLAENKKAFTFEGWVRDAEQWVHEVLTKAGYQKRGDGFLKVGAGPAADKDSDEDFADRILFLISKVRTAIKDGDAARAAMDGVRLGELIALYDTKTMHEPAWNTGTKNRRGLAVGRERSNADRHEIQKSEWARWNAAADPIWRRHPDWSKNEVARQIIKTLKPPPTYTVKGEQKLAKVATVAKHLKKPRTAG